MEPILLPQRHNDKVCYTARGPTNTIPLTGASKQTVDPRRAGHVRLNKRIVPIGAVL